MSEPYMKLVEFVADEDKRVLSKEDTARDLFTPDWEAVERQFQAPLTTNFDSLTQVKKEKLVKVRNKFYVASPAVTTAGEQDQINDPKNVRLSVSPLDRGGKWTRKDLASAIEHATQLLRDDPSKDHVAVVRIVKIVRRREAPVVVENV